MDTYKSPKIFLRELLRFHNSKCLKTQYKTRFQINNISSFNKDKQNIQIEQVTFKSGVKNVDDPCFRHVTINSVTELAVDPSKVRPGIDGCCAEFQINPFITDCEVATNSNMLQKVHIGDTFRLLMFEENDIAKSTFISATHIK